MAKGRGSRFRSGDEERVNLPSKSVVRKRRQREREREIRLSTDSYPSLDRQGKIDQYPLKIGD